MGQTQLTDTSEKGDPVGRHYCNPFFSVSVCQERQRTGPTRISWWESNSLSDFSSSKVVKGGKCWSREAGNGTWKNHDKRPKRILSNFSLVGNRWVFLGDFKAVGTTIEKLLAHFDTDFRRGFIPGISEPNGFSGGNFGIIEC